MPHAPLPPELDRFPPGASRRDRGDRDAADGAPVTTPCWYDWADGEFTLSMSSDGPRLRNLENDPRVALTVLADDWYEHVSLLGRAVEFRDDPDLVDIDALSQRYVGEPYEDRTYRGTTVVAEATRWHIWGDPGASV